MLSTLHIENIAVIEQAEIAFDSGFNVLTGETGAGKSIVIDAISAILGERASREMIRTGSQKAFVSAIFTGVPELPWFAENQVPYEPELGMKGDYLYEERMMLEGMFPNGKKDVALNDIVVSRKGDDLRIIYFKLFVNGELLNSYEADGIIISTPTGSTAYNMSAGGPIVEPTASLTVITPICSHALNTRSIVLSSDDEIVIEIGEGRRGNIEKVLVTFDGATSVPLETGDRLTICKAKESTKIMKINKISFLEILRRKMKGN